MSPPHSVVCIMSSSYLIKARFWPIWGLWSVSYNFSDIIVAFQAFAYNEQPRWFEWPGKVHGTGIGTAFHQPEWRCAAIANRWAPQNAVDCLSWDWLHLTVYFDSLLFKKSQLFYSVQFMITLLDPEANHWADGNKDIFYGTRFMVYHSFY